MIETILKVDLIISIILDNLFMKKCNQNEQYLLRFISGESQDSTKNSEILEAICKLGIKLQFNNTNPVYQIIDELTYAGLIGK